MDELEKELQEMMKEAEDERIELNSDETDDLDEKDELETDKEEKDEIDNKDDNDDETKDNLDDSDDDEIDDDNDDDDIDNKDDDNLDGDDVFEPIEVEVGGSKIKINSQEELVKLATKGIGSVNIETNKDSIVDKFVKQADISQAELTLLADIKNGDVNAIAKLAELAKIDTLDIDSKLAGEYKPGFQLTQETDVEIAAGEIVRDVEHATEFRKITSELPQAFVTAISSDANKLIAFSGHIKSGLAQKVLPEAMKEVAVNGGSLFDAYAKIGYKMSQEKPAEEKVEVKEKRVVSKKEKEMRDRANGDDKSGDENTDTSATDIWDMSDDEFDAIVAESSK